MTKEEMNAELKRIDEKAKPLTLFGAVVSLVTLIIFGSIIISAL